MDSPGRNTRRRSMSAINVTPFIDVMLVLLIIFMVTAPMMTSGLDVSLPETSHTEPIKEDTKALVISVAEDGRIYIDGTMVPKDEAKIKSILESNLTTKAKPIQIEADGKTAYQNIATVLAAAKSSGATNIGMVTKVKEGS